MTVSITRSSIKQLPELRRGTVTGFGVDPTATTMFVTRHSVNAGTCTTLHDLRSGSVIADDLRWVTFLHRARRAVVHDGAGVSMLDLDDGRRTPLAGITGRVEPTRGEPELWSHDGKVIVTRDGAGKVLGKLPSPPTRAAVPGAHAPSFSAVHPLPDGKTIAWLDARFHVHLLDLAACKSVADITGGLRELPRHFLVAKDGKKALALGAKGGAVVFDLETRKAVVKKERAFVGPPKNVAWLDDGRLVTDDLDVVDLGTWKRASFGERDRAREPVHAIYALEGPRVLVHISRVLDPTPPVIPTRFFEVWDVDTKKRLASLEVEEAHAPTHLGPNGVLLAVELGEDVIMETRWRSYRVAGNAAPAAKALAAKKPAVKKPAAKKPAAKKPAVAAKKPAVAAKKKVRA